MSEVKTRKPKHSLPRELLIYFRYAIGNYFEKEFSDFMIEYSPEIRAQLHSSYRKRIDNLAIRLARAGNDFAKCRSILHRADKTVRNLLILRLVFSLNSYKRYESSNEEKEQVRSQGEILFASLILGNEDADNFILLDYRPNLSFDSNTYPNWNDIPKTGLE